MTHAALLWSIWQAMLQRFAWAFSRRGYRRFAEWMTAMATNVEEHTVTQSVLALQRPFDWKAMESFAEYAAWHTDRVTRSLVNLVETAPGRLWHGYRVSALWTVVPHHTSKLWSAPTASSARSRRRGYEGGAQAAMIVQLIGETTDYPAFVNLANAIICFRRARD